MHPIEKLMSEHRQIERAMAALEAYASLVAKNDPAAVPADLQLFVTFVQRYADAYHHAKEEDILFEAMVQHGFPKEAGPIAVMLMEHNEGRNYIQTLGEATSIAGFWTDEDRSAIHQNAMNFTGLLRPHIMKEDSILYPMSLKQLPPPAWEEIGKHFASVEERFGAEPGALLKTVDELAARYATR